MRLTLITSAILLSILFLVPFLIASGPPLADDPEEDSEIISVISADELDFIYKAPYLLPAADDLQPSLEVEEEPAAEPETLPASVPAAATPAGLNKLITDGTQDNKVTIRVKDGEKTTEQKLGDYLAGVVAGEMPASFPLEALKAQAVAARTFILYRMENGAHPSHPDADVCTDSRCCKAYLSLETAAQNWNGKADEYTKLFREAVRTTDGQIVVYENEPILAVFHAASGGRTENSADVWGGELPYLTSVDSPGESYEKTYVFTAKECKALLLKKWPKMKLSGNAKSWFGKSVTSEAGGVKSITIGGVSVTGAQLRSVLGLSSARFTVSYANNKFTISCLGYGHGVGMSQYGAKAMALEGKNYQEILSWYYQNTSLALLSITD